MARTIARTAVEKAGQTIEQTTGQRRKRVLVTAGDRLLLYVVVGAALVLLLTGLGRTAGSFARVAGEGGFERSVTLSEDTTIEVPGPLGSTVVEVKDGRVGVLSSPCPHQLCRRMGTVNPPGLSVVCVPNRVVITVDGGGPPSTDAITR